MNKCKKIFASALFICVLFSMISFSYANEDVINVNVIDDLFDNIIEIANIIMVVLNFLFVIFVFYKDKNDSKKDEVKKYDEYWYNKFIIDNNIQILDKFFGELKQIMLNVYCDIEDRNDSKKSFDVLDYAQEVFERWTKLHNECKSEFCEKIDVVMPEFGSELRNDFSVLQDYVTDRINELILCQDNEEIKRIETEVNDKLNELKKLFIKKLYIKGKPNKK